jgi:hypothetical protein
MYLEMEASLMAAQGRYEELRRLWSCLSNGRKLEALQSIPITEPFQFYSDLCNEAIVDQKWYVDRAVLVYNTVGLQAAFPIAAQAGILSEKLQNDLQLFDQLLKYVLNCKQSQVAEDISFQWPSRNSLMELLSSLSSDGLVALLPSVSDPELISMVSSLISHRVLLQEVLYDMTELNLRILDTVNFCSSPQQSSTSTSQTSPLPLHMIYQLGHIDQ